MYYALPEHLQETTFLLFMVCSLFISRKTAGLGAGGGFFHCFQKARTTHMLTFRDCTMISHQKSHRKGQHQRSNMWFQWFQLQGHYQAVARPLGRWLHAGDTWRGTWLVRREQPYLIAPPKGTDSGWRERTSPQSHGQSESGHPAQGHPYSPFCSPGRHPSYCQGAYRLESQRVPVPTGLLHHWQTVNHGPCLGLSFLTYKVGWDQMTSTRHAGHE